MKSWRVMAALAASCCFGGEAPREQARAPAKPEKIDVVYERLGVQRRTLEAVVQIVTQLEAVANQSGAVAELLSDQDDPTERLKRALDEVVSERLASAGAGTVEPVVVEAQTALAGDVPEAVEEPRRDVAVEVVYAERSSTGRGGVVVAVGGAHYAASVGQRILTSEDIVDVVRIVEEADGPLTVVLRINGDTTIRRRVRS